MFSLLEGSGPLEIISQNYFVEMSPYYLKIPFNNTWKTLNRPFVPRINDFVRRQLILLKLSVDFFQRSSEYYWQKLKVTETSNLHVISALSIS